MDFKNDRAFPGILAFQYGRFVRARGEVLLKKDNIKRLPWIDVCSLSDAQFCERLEFPLADFKLLQREIKQTKELDSMSWRFIRAFKRTREKPRPEPGSEEEARLKAKKRSEKKTAPNKKASDGSKKTN